MKSNLDTAESEPILVNNFTKKREDETLTSARFRGRDSALEYAAEPSEHRALTLAAASGLRRRLPNPAGQPAKG